MGLKAGPIAPCSGLYRPCKPAVAAVSPALASRMQLHTTHHLLLPRRQRTCTVSAQQQGAQKPPGMPRLPDRPAKGPSSSLPPKISTTTSSSSSSSSSTRRPPPPRRPLPPSPPPEQQQQAQERTLAGLLAYSGLLGTVATLISVVLPDVDLFGNFQLVPADILLGLQLLLPACLLNVAIMLPDYSSWKVPAEPTLEAQQKMAEALLAWTANRKAAADAAAAASSAAPTAAAGAGGELEPASSSTSSAAAGHSSSSSSATSSSQEAGEPTQGLPQPAAASSSSIIINSSSTAGPGEQQARPVTPPAGASPPWLIDNPDPPLPLPLARCKDALLMAQGHYLSATPRVTLPWPMQVGVLLINCMAAELLYRSVLLQVSGGWLTDRILEAGAEDAFLAAAAHLPVLPTPHMTGQLAAIALLSGAWGVAVGRQVLRMSRRPSLAMASQGKVAAGKLMQDMQRLAATMPKQHGQQGQQPGPSQQQQQQQQQPSQPEQQQPGSGSHLQSAGDEPPSPSSQDTQSSQQAAPQIPPASSSASPSQEAAKLALAAATDQSGPGSSSPRSSGSKPKRQGPGGPVPNTLGALALSQVVTGVRDLSQAAGLGLAFALTGNLAAPFVAAVVTDGLMALLQRHGQERSRQRSIAFAKHFASFTRVLRDVQRQQTLKQERAADSQQQPAAQPADGAASTQQDSPGLGGPPFSAAHAHSADADNPLDAAVAAAAAAPDAAALHAAAAAAAASAEGPAAAGGSGPAGGSGSRMESTIQLLDQLVVEQLTEHAAAAGPHK